MCSNSETVLSAIVTMEYIWGIGGFVCNELEMLLSSRDNLPYNALEKLLSRRDNRKSPTFCNDTFKNIKWHLSYDILNKNGSEYISLFATCELTDGYSVSLVPPKIEFTIILGDNMEVPVNTHNQLCVCHDKIANCWDFPKFTNYKSIVNSITPVVNGHYLSFRVKCKIMHTLSVVPKQTNRVLHYDIGQLLATQKFSDVKLKVNEETFYAHKSILAARSSVFEAMFEHEMLENVTSFVNITETDNKVFKDMLTFIYSDQAPNLKDTVFGLLPMADKYQLDALKDTCATYLRNNLTTENVVDVLILADLYRSIELKEKAIAYINKHGVKITATEGYKSLVMSHPHLIGELHQALVTMRCACNGIDNDGRENH